MLGTDLPSKFEKVIDESMLKGHDGFDIEPIQHFSKAHRESFKKHLEELHITKDKLPKEKWDDWLYSISVIDIRSPLEDVFAFHNLSKNLFKGVSREKVRKFVNSMPSRRLDLHLCRQVLRNPNYKPKVSDLEDWAGLGIASCYCDVVVCEKHFADMVKRDGFKSKANVITSVYELPL